MIWLIIASSILVAISIYFIFTSHLDTSSDISKRIAYNTFFREKVLYNRLLKKINKNSIYIKFYSYINSILYKSGIKRFLPWLNTNIFIFMLVCCFFLVSFLFRKLGLLVAITYGIIGTIILISVLLFFVMLNKQKVRKNYLTFLNIFTNFYASEDNEINALEKTADYVEEPLKYVLKKWTNIYKKSNKSLDECMDGILLELGGDTEFRKFISFTKQNMKYGGDYKKALEKLNKQGRKTAEILSVKASSAIFGTFIILLIILVNLFMLWNGTKEPEVLSFMQTAKGQFNIIANALAILFALYMIININKD